MMGATICCCRKQKSRDHPLCITKTYQDEFPRNATKKTLSCMVSNSRNKLYTSIFKSMMT